MPLTRMVTAAGLAAILAGGAVLLPERVEAYEWSGFYIGGHVGGGWGNATGRYSDTRDRFADAFDGATHYYNGGANYQVDDDWARYALGAYANIPPDAILDYRADGDLNGFVGGLQAGGNLQSGMFVFGVDASLSLADISGRSSFSTTYSGSPDVIVSGDFHTSVSWLGMLRGRAGVALGQFLPYVAGGLAIAGVRARGDITVAAGDPGNLQDWVTVDGSQSRAAFGSALGAGIEVAFSDRLTGFVEYDRINLCPFGVEIGAGANFDFDVDLDLVRAGLNVRF